MRKRVIDEIDWAKISVVSSDGSGIAIANRLSIAMHVDLRLDDTFIGADIASPTREVWPTGAALVLIEGGRAAAVGSEGNVVDGLRLSVIPSS